MIYREFSLPERAQSAAWCAWRFALEPGDPAAVDHNVPPDGTTNILVAAGPGNIEHIAIVGPSVDGRVVPVATGWSYAGLRLRPEAAKAVTGVDPVTIVGGSVVGAPIADALRPIVASLTMLARSPDGWTGEEIAAALDAIKHPVDGLVANAVDRIMAGSAPSMASLARTSGVGDRQFRRRFVAATGLSPKRFGQVQRLRRALILSLDLSWASVAQDAGYSDQPHLTRAIHRSFRASPTRVGGYIGGIKHEFLAPTGVRFVQDAEAPAT